MQYALRFVLSLMVVVSHFWADLLPGGDGALAVMGFYVISGYVITLVWTKSYSKAPSGFKRFWFNRFIRLYPVFIVSSTIGFIVIYFFPEATREISPSMVLPWSPEGIERIVDVGISPTYQFAMLIPQLILIGYQAPILWVLPITFSPNAWSVNMELYFYLAMSLGLTATFSRAQRFCIFSTAVVGTYFSMLVWLGHGIFATSTFLPYVKVYYYLIFYKSPVGIMFFFALGALVYYVPKRVYPTTFKVVAVIALFTIPFLDVPTTWSIVARLLVFGTLCALVLHLWSDAKPTGFLKFVGDLSYPLFLIHWQMGALVAAITDLEKNSLLFFVLATSLSLLASVILVQFLERPLERYRAKIRPI